MVLEQAYILHLKLLWEVVNAKVCKGRYAKRISDRSGMAFPYNEMVKEWNGSTVHIRIQN